ncbi:glycosyltransferase [Limnohabitans sp.]|uniref:glycosyltransferase n=1 Tax=Limnohabitans sp. TaxID=1907725 RepID=UPI00286F2EBD|nr:glycosyltransferase [Limnohabitans sp.]
MSDASFKTYELFGALEGLSFEQWWASTGSRKLGCGCLELQPGLEISYQSNWDEFKISVRNFSLKNVACFTFHDIAAVVDASSCNLLSMNPIAWPFFKARISPYSINKSLSVLIGMRQLGFEVEVFERLPYRVFQGFYGAIDCLLMCSGHEGGPASVPESLATGTPVLTSRVGMSIDLIIDGDNGYFLELNPDEDANVIHRLASSPQAYASLEATCRSLAAEVPTWRDSIQENLTVYGQIAGFDLKTPPAIVVTPVFDTLEIQT